MDMIPEKPRTLCTRCSYMRRGWLSQRLCGHPSSIKGYDAVDGGRYLKPCHEVNDDGDCDLYFPKWWRFWE